MKHSIKKSLTLFSLLFFTLAGSAQMVLGYLPYYRGFNANYDYGKYTHLHYFALWPASDGTFIYPGAEDSLSMAQEFKLLSDAAKPQGTKMIIAFGGTSENGSEHFAEVCRDAQKRAFFVQNIINIAQSWEADGIDIDWEWGGPGQPAGDTAAFTNLMFDLKEAINGTGLTLSADVSPSSRNGNNYSIGALKVCDYVNVMSYSYSGAWAQVTGHHSSLNDIKSIAVNYWLGRGMLKEELNIGTAFYGFLYSGTSAPNTGFTTAQAQTFTQVTNLINSGYVVVEDDNEGTYAYSTAENKIVFYDSPSNVAAKMDYVVEESLAGVIIWEIGQDDNNQTLTNALGEDLITNSEHLSFLNEQKIVVTTTNNILNVQSLDNELIHVQVFTLDGKLMYEASNKLSVNYASLNSGKVFIVKTIKGNKTYTQKVLF